MKPITKSQFKLGLDCPLKLRYAREGLPQATAGNELLQLLSEGGAAVEALVRAVEPPAFLGTGGGEEAAKVSFEMIATAVRAARDTGSTQALYEVTIAHGDFVARIDLLRVHVNRLEVVEIKSKSISNSSSAADAIIGERGHVLSEWVPYIQDITFQGELLRRWIAQHAIALGVVADLSIVHKLRLVCRSGRASAQDVLARFKSRYTINPRSTRATVTYSGNAIDSSALLCECEVEAAVALIRDNCKSSIAPFKGLGISACMSTMRDMVLNESWPAARECLASACKDCEYRIRGDENSGFARCWGTEVECTRFHVLELAWLSDKQLKGAMNAAGVRTPVVSDVSETNRTPRQWSQFECAHQLKPLVARDFAMNPATKLRTADPETPIYFLDFECSSYPIPIRVGGSPYELIPFQFEAHKMPSSSACLSARERLPGFLDLASDDPRRNFLLALESQLGTTGIIYHWHSYEATVLRTVRQSITAENTGTTVDRRLVAFVNTLIGDGPTDHGRLIDLLVIARSAFCHPDMRGSYSIKKVLPIVWREESIRKHFVSRHGAKGDPCEYAAAVDPYDALPSLPKRFIELIGGANVVKRIKEADEDSPSSVRNGGMAMLFFNYVRMLGGAEREDVREQFKNYCGLDSAAMAMVFDYMRRIVPTFTKVEWR